MWCSAIGCIVTLTLSMLVAPLAATAQQPAHLPKVGWLDEGNWTDKARLYATFLEGLRELGSVEGQHLVIARRDAEGHLDRLPGLAAELVRLPVDVIVTTGAYQRPVPPCRRRRRSPSSWQTRGIPWGRASSRASRGPAGTSRGCP